MVKKAKQKVGARNEKRPYSIEKANTKKTPTYRENPEEYIKKESRMGF